MGYVREPDGVDFIVDPKPLSVQDRKKISAIITYYKITGKKMKATKERIPRKKNQAKQKRLNP